MPGGTDDRFFLRLLKVCALSALKMKVYFPLLLFPIHRCDKSKKFKILNIQKTGSDEIPP